MSTNDLFDDDENDVSAERLQAILYANDLQPNNITDELGPLFSLDDPVGWVRLG